MLMYLQLMLIAALPGIVAVVVYLIQKKGWLDRFNEDFKQTIIGLIFGFIACLGTAFGVDVGGALANTRDAAIVCAGLIFGGPAGIIAGIIGGLYRWFAVYWGAGEFTRIACSSACVIAGFYAAFVRKYMFDKKLPGWIMSFFVGTVMEVVHLILLFFTNLSDLKKTLGVLDALAIPMIICNGIGVMLPILALTIISRDSIFYSRKKNKVRISQTVQSWLLGTVTVALVLSSLFTFSLQAVIAKMDTKNVLQHTISDIKNDIKDASDENLHKLTEKIGDTIDKTGYSNPDRLREMVYRYDVDEISVVSEAGIIVASTNPKYIGFDMATGEQSYDFIKKLYEMNHYEQDYMPIAFDESVYMKYAGVLLEDGGFVQVGYGSEKFYDDLSERVEQAAVNVHLDESGYVVITDKDYNIKSIGSDSGIRITGDESERTIFDTLFKGADEYTMVKGDINGLSVYAMYTTSESYYIIGVYPEDEAFFTRNIAFYANGFTEIIVFAVLFAVIYILIRVIVVNNIHKINASLAEITGGNLNTVVDVHDNEEFAVLSNDINSTVETLKRYIEEAASRIDAELQYAKDIQASALPHIAPNFVGKSEYELYSFMDTAKEVGGDFYDYYYVDESHLAITIADVSGKGIPAALFMMTSKTMLRNLIESGMPIDEAVSTANDRLCENNDANMFVTVWAAVVDLKTGHVEFANAGHNPPVIKRADGSFDFLKCKAGLVLAAMDGIPYKKQEFDLRPGDVLYLYTDGVTEATDANEELFSEARLIKALDNSYASNPTMENLCLGVKKEVDDFVGEAPQFDDISMVSLKYNG